MHVYLFHDELSEVGFYQDIRFILLTHHNVYLIENDNSFANDDLAYYKLDHRLFLVILYEIFEFYSFSFLGP